MKGQGVSRRHRVDNRGRGGRVWIGCGRFTQGSDVAVKVLSDDGLVSVIIRIHHSGSRCTSVSTMMMMMTVIVSIRGHSCWTGLSPQLGLDAAGLDDGYRHPRQTRTSLS